MIAYRMDFIKGLLVTVLCLGILAVLPTRVFALDLDAVNQMDQDTFVQEFGGIFEKSPWVAEKAWESRPFTSIEELHETMFNVIKNASREEQIAFLNNHPELAGKEAQAGTMTAASVAEQASAGLNALSKEELERLNRLNAEYRAKHGFPFMIFVRGHTKEGIFFYLERRLKNDTDTELKNALDQVFGITRSRLDKKFATG